MDRNDLLEPRKAYDMAKDIHLQNVKDYFDDLVNKSHIDVEENKRIISHYKAILEKYNLERKETNKMKNIKKLVLFLIVLFVALFLGFLLFGIQNKEVKILNIIFSALFLTLAIVLIVLLKNKISKKISGKNLIMRDLEKQLDETRNKGYENMAPLNALYTYNMHTSLVSKSVPLIELDENFNVDRYYYMKDKFKLSDNNDVHRSTVFVQSGAILGNPFIIEKNYVQESRMVNYEGSLHISWTETIRVNNRTQVVRKNQTLYASVSKPAPFYYFDTWLIYGNDAAPNLTFSRIPSSGDDMSEKEREKYIKSFDKKLDKMVEKDIDDTSGDQFTRLSNTEFEAFFKALDRSDEVEFRLLFTPLAQKNMLELILNDKPYGDDFYFIKDHKLNFIKSAHSQGKDFKGSPDIFYNFDYEAARDYFIEYNVDYFKCLYFDLAPLLSIPLYQQTKTKEYIYEEEYKSNVSSFEHEVMANAFNKNIFRTEYMNTNLILKAKFMNKKEKIDNVTVNAYSFTKERKIEYVPVFGGDGRMHDVPVPYDEYTPVQNSYLIEVENENKKGDNINSSQNENKSDIVYERGLIAHFIR